MLKNKKAEGIGTLIVFIAMILVVVIAAGVFINFFNSLILTDDFHTDCLSKEQAEDEPTPDYEECDLYINDEYGTTNFGWTDCLRMKNHCNRGYGRGLDCTWHDKEFAYSIEEVCWEKKHIAICDCKGETDDDK